MSATPPKLAMRIRHGNFLTVELETPSRSLVVPTGVTPQHMVGLRRNFYSELRKFVELVSWKTDSNPGWAQATKSIRFLHKIGRQVNFQFFGPKRYEVEDLFKETFATWQSSVLENYIPPMIEVSAPGDCIPPLEFIPMFDTSELPPDITDLRSLTSACARFLGFSTVINRVIQDPFIDRRSFSDTHLSNEPTLKLRYFRNADLNGAEKEEDFFKGCSWINLKGPWPERELIKSQMIAEIADLLWKAQHASDGAGGLDQIHHFSCHCDTTQPNPTQYALTLAHRKKNFFNNYDAVVEIGKLEQAFGSFPQRQQGVPYPLVFLNVCGGARFDPLSISSFPNLFLKIGNRGIISTETAIHDDFAAQFSIQFYSNLQQGLTIGQAIARARWFMLSRYKNPAGILYTLYTNPDIRVKRPVSINFPSLPSK